MQVAAGIIADVHGRVLIARRPHGAHQGGLWEFPGGKLAPGEDAGQGLARELAEELGIRVRSSRPLLRVRHEYSDRIIQLEIRRVTNYCGSPSGLEGQPLDWVAPMAMDPARFPAADRPVIDALRLPPHYLITDTPAAAPERFLERLERALAANRVGLAQLRAHELDDGAYAALAADCAERCRARGVRLVLNRDPAVAAALPGDGIHLSAARLRASPARVGGEGRLIGASCHDRAELLHAAALGLDYALLSPVRATTTHPGTAPLGWDGFARLAGAAAIPVYALGGVGPADLEQAQAHGAQGIAGIRAFWPR